MKISGKQVTAARDLLGITQAELANAAGLSKDTVFMFEAGKANPQKRNLQKIVAELELRGIEFINGDRQPSMDPGIGVRLNLTKAAAYTSAKG